MKFFTTKEFAELVGVSIRTLKYWRSTGKLIPVSTGAKGAKFYSEVQIAQVQGCKGASLGVQTTNNFEKSSTFAPVEKVVTSELKKGFEKMKTIKNNIPTELQWQKRFFACKIEEGQDGKIKKIPVVTGWNNPKNQKSLSQLKDTDLIGFDVCGYGVRDEYCFLDFDHVIDDETGEFVNVDVEMFVSYFLDSFGKFNTYCEKSISGTGLHIFLKPTAGKFGIYTADKTATLYFDDKHAKDSPKLEFWYSTEGRYCLITGDTIFCKENAKIPSQKFADRAFEMILNKIARQQNNLTAQQNNLCEVEENVTAEVVRPDERDEQQEPKPQTTSTSNNFYSHYDNEKIKACFECIEVDKLPSYNYWLAFMTCCKNLGFSYADVDEKNKMDSSRYDEKANFATWQSLKDNSFSLSTLCGIARKFCGFDSRKFDSEYQKKYGGIYLENDSPAVCDSARPKAENEIKFDSKYLSESDFFKKPPTDYYNSQRILSLFGGKIKLNRNNLHWFTYENNNWIDGGEKNPAVYSFAKQVTDEILKKAGGGELAIRWQKKAVVSNAVELMKSHESIYITQEDLNRHKNLIPCNNGVVDLTTGILYPHDPKYLFTNMATAEFRADCPENDDVKKFLCDILPDEETRQSLLRYLGYCLTGEVNEEKALFIYGAGGNGKGTLTNLLNSVFGDWFCSFPIEGILKQTTTKDGDACTPAFNKLIGKRLAVAEEIPQGRKLDAAKFKNLTGGDVLHVRQLHQEAQDYKNPSHKFVFSGNHLPEIEDVNDAGIQRRWIQIPFEVAFNDQNRDPNLKNKLVQSVAKNYFFSLLVAEAVKWYKDGLIISAKMQRDRKEYFEENDFVGEFVRQSCEFKENYFVSRQEILKALKENYYREVQGFKDTKLLKKLQTSIKQIFGEGVEYDRRNKGFGFVNLFVEGCHGTQQNKFEFSE